MERKYVVTFKCPGCGHEHTAWSDVELVQGQTLELASCGDCGYKAAPPEAAVEGGGQGGGQ